MKLLATGIVLALSTAYGFSQERTEYAPKPPIDHSVYTNWPEVAGGQLSDDGRYFMYTTGVHGKSWTLTIQALEGDWKRQVESVDGCRFTPDNKLAIVQVGNWLKLVPLGTSDVEERIKINTWKMPENSREGWLAYQVDSSKELIIRDLHTGNTRIIGPVENYLFNDSGTVLLYEMVSQPTVSDSLLAKAPRTLYWLNLEDGHSKAIWEGTEASGYVFDNKGIQLAFVAPLVKGSRRQYALWYYIKGAAQAEQRVDADSPGIEAGFRITPDDLRFSDNGSWIYFKLDGSPAGSKEEFFAGLNEREQSEWTRKLIFNPDLQPWVTTTANPDAVQVNVRSYLDPLPQPAQIKDAAVGTAPKSKIVLLTGAGGAQESIMDAKGNFVLVRSHPDLTLSTEWKWNPAGRSSVYLIALSDGTRGLLKEGLEGAAGRFWLSPNGRFVLYGDPEQKRYASYETASGTWRNLLLSPDMDCSRSDQDWPIYRYVIAETEAWLETENAVLMRDRYDIWKMDLLGHQPLINITQGSGRRQQVVFRFLRPQGGAYELAQRNLTPAPEKGYWLCGFNKKDKSMGFYYLPGALLGKAPQLQSAGAYAYERGMDLAPLRAKKAAVYVVKRETAAIAPNYYWTKDFKNFTPISKCRPEQEYNWMSSELLRWKTFDGTFAEGVLYKPENFDPRKKYPIVFDFYEEQSEYLHHYLTPAFGASTLPVSWLVSNGYLVFRPDIHYKIGTPGLSAYNHVVSAARYLSSFPWVNAQRMAIQGASWGGYEVNYIVTHTSIFSAAYSGCGLANLVSVYGSEKDISIMDIESGQLRIGATLWEAPELFIKGSPVFEADKITTPILLMHNKRDGAVPYTQGLQFFRLLRRLRKKVWMLEYDQGQHGVAGKDSRDLNTRIEQFFDHYLKDAPPPQWMTQGIRAADKGFITGLELDISGRVP